MINRRRTILMAALLMVAITILLIGGALVAADTGTQISGFQTVAETRGDEVYGNPPLFSVRNQGPGDDDFATEYLDDDTDPSSAHWETLEYTERSVGTTDSVTIWSMDSTQRKYCAPVVQNSTTGTIKGALIDLITGQEVHVYWYHDTLEICDYTLNLDASPYLSTTFPDEATPATIAPFNTIGTHTIKIEVRDTSNNLLASDEKSYEIVSCSGCSLTLGPPSSQCLGVLPDNIPGNITRGGSSEISVYWWDETGFQISGTIPEGSFNAVEAVAPTMINDIYNTPGFHFLRIDAPLDFSDPTSPYVSNTVTFNIQPCPGTYYVNIASGNDSNVGSQANPWKTLHHAISQINGGVSGTYTLLMAAGTYSTGNGEANNTAITLSQSNVTILGADDHTIGASNTTTLIDGTDGGAAWTAGINIAGSNVTIRGLSIKNFSAGVGYGIHISGGTENEVGNCKISNNNTGIEIAAGSNAFKIRHCEIYSNTTDGLNVTSSTDGEIYRNTIYRHQGAGNDGVAVFNCSPEIKRNKIYDNNTGVRVEADSSNTASPDIRNNVIYETIAYFMAYGILVNGTGGTASPTIYHNSIDAGSGDGIAVEQTSASTLEPVIKYNIITRCDVYGIDVVSGVTCTIDYNDVWNNGAGNYNGCTAGTNDISQDPKNGMASELAPDSPCIDTIPTGNPPNDLATMDYPGYSRPQGSGFDMGAYEYVPTKTYTDTLPGGTGIETDYRIFTIPLDIGTGLDMRNTIEGTLGAYDPTHWRVFARTTSGYIEMNTQAFASLDIKPGMGFWGITVYTNTISFQGTLSPNAIYYKIELAPGWHLFAVPWPNTSIDLGKIYVTDGVTEYAITNASNTLTQQKIWDYTGTGPSSGYEIRDSGTFALIAGTGYFIKVLGSSNIILSIPPNNSFGPPALAMRYGAPQSVRLPDDVEPPPFPDGSYGPVPDIRANGKSGSVTVSNGTPVSITVSLDPGNRAVKKADWWVAAHTPFAPPFDWYSYVYPNGWQPGIHVCVQIPPFQLPPSFEVLNMALPAGDYTIYFAVDENADGIVDETWVDSVEVRVE